VAIRPLLPAGTLIARRGLPSVVLMRALIAGALFGAEIYVPYLLIDDYGFSATTAGLGLTSAALLWAVGADVQGRVGDRLGNARITLVGASLLIAATLAAAATAAWHLPPWVLIAGWVLAGAGMGPHVPASDGSDAGVLDAAEPGLQLGAVDFGFGGASASIAVMGLTFVALSASDAAFPAVFLIATALAVIAVLPGLRMGHVAESEGLRR
jgi:MFS family permease